MTLPAALDSFCARTNEGLTAMALVLTLVLAVSAMARYPDGLPALLDAATGIEGGAPTVTVDPLVSP